MAKRHGFYSQFGEDAILADFFSDLPKGVAVEVGAYDGVDASNSYYFEQKGWDCILVEPNPDLAGRIRKTRPNSQLFECAAGSKDSKIVLQIPEGDETLASVASSAAGLRRDAALKTARKRSGDEPVQVIKDVEVGVRRLDDILQQAGIDHIDFMTIDVEGFELDALRGLSLDRWKPRVVILEDNDFGGNEAVLDYMESQGYCRFRNTGCNDWYGRRGDLALFGKRQMILTEIRKTYADMRKVLGRHARRLKRMLRPSH